MVTTLTSQAVAAQTADQVLKWHVWLKQCVQHIYAQSLLVLKA